MLFCKDCRYAAGDLEVSPGQGGGARCHSPFAGTRDPVHGVELGEPRPLCSDMRKHGAVCGTFAELFNARPVGSSSIPLTFKA